MTDVLPKTTVFKSLPRAGFTHISDLPFVASTGNGASTHGVIARIRDHSRKESHGFNDRRIVVVDSNGRIWMKDGTPTSHDLNFITNLYPKHSRVLPGLNGEVLEPEHLDARRKNPICGIN
ncbi:MAG: hypothetical protein AAB518_03005 [Patescibacteria group bacterium]